MGGTIADKTFPGSPEASPTLPAALTAPSHGFAQYLLSLMGLLRTCLALPRPLPFPSAPGSRKVQPEMNSPKAGPEGHARGRRSAAEPL